MNKVSDKFDKGVMDEEYSGRESIKLFKDNVKNEKLVRERIIVDDELWLKGKTIEFMKKVEDDPAGDVLLEAFKKYHSKSLQVMLKDLSKRLSASRLGSGFYDRRMVRIDCYWLGDWGFVEVYREAFEAGEPQVQ